MGASVFVDRRTALEVFGPSRGGSPPELMASVSVGAAPVVAAQLAVALDPVHPEVFEVGAVTQPRIIRERITADTTRLFLLLAAFSLVVGAFGIANITLSSVLARRGEIGLRCAMGALPRHVVSQVLGEAALTGALGGFVGALVGLFATLGVALANDWTAVFPPWALLVGPLLGALIGLVAGWLPAVKAARMEPTEALRMG